MDFVKAQILKINIYSLRTWWREAEYAFRSSLVEAKSPSRHRHWTMVACIPLNLICIKTVTAYFLKLKSQRIIKNNYIRDMHKT